MIGGGITGAGVARHAALAGLDTVLVEASDFSAGTSSRSTKLIHGGLRYLAMGDVGLVRETALERKHLYRLAPHLTEPRWMVVPAASILTMMKLRAGITAYERLGAVASADRHRNWSRAQLEIEEPELDSARFAQACVYREYLTDDTRLVLATLRAALAAGAEVCNYARVVRVGEPARGGGADAPVPLEIEDMLGGGRTELAARVVVNATGPWVEQLAHPEAATGNGAGRSTPRLHLSKGVHIAVPSHRLPVRNMVMLTAADERPVFAIPRGTVTYVGTTDTSVRGRPDLWPEVTRADVDYLLELLERYFPRSEIGAADVVSTWAGLRPLINQPGKAPKEMSRKEEIWVEGRVVTIAGGKLTGFRKMAEQVMARVSDLLGVNVPDEAPLEVLPGGALDCPDTERRRVAERYDVAPAVAARLVRLYGSEVGAVLGERPTPITTAVFAEEIDWAIDCESALTLEDVVYRRLRVPWFRPEDAEAVAVAAAQRLARRGCWSDTRQREALDALASRLRGDLAFSHS